MNTPGQNTSKPLQSLQANPFARALTEIGGSTVKTAAAIPGEMVNDAMAAIFGSSSGQSALENSAEQNQSTNPFAKALEQSSKMEDEKKNMELEKARAVRHKEMQMTEVFNAREAKDKEIIRQLQEQLRALAKEVKTLDNSIKTAIHSDVVDPGTYHVHFFQQLLNFVVLLRKRVQEANTWIENFNSRHKKQGAFWSQVNSKKGGTAYLMSQEHQVARSVG